jgi:mRNA interferase MazF
MAYVPDRGDAVWITLNPQAGHEQAGRRPAVILSPAAYNGKVGLAILCPITNQIKGYPFEVLIPPGLAVTGVFFRIRSRALIGGRGMQALFVRCHRQQSLKCSKN